MENQLLKEDLTQMKKCKNMFNLKEVLKKENFIKLKIDNLEK